MKFIDTHCHLDLPEFADDREEVIKRAFDEGITAIINVGTDLASSRTSIELADKYPGVFAAAGIHPHEAAKQPDGAVKEIETMARSGKVVAIGETGLDYHYGAGIVEEQKALFRAHIELAASLDLPLIVHQRESGDDLTAILDETARPRRVVLHCFGGEPRLTEFCLARGYFVSFTGIVTFPNAQAVREAVAAYPKDRVLAETDAPYLSPVPFRGKRNEPARVRFVAENVAGLMGLTLQEGVDQLYNNSVQFFDLKL
jgi:TatD DNase family protein